MSSPNDVSMEEILLEDDERDSIEYKILMAYAQRRLSARKYGKLLKNEANVQKSSSLIRREVNIDHQRDKDGPSPTAVCQSGVILIAFFISHPPSQSGETADVNHIADKLAKLVTSRSKKSPSDVSFKIMCHAPSQEQDNSVPTDGSEGKEHDEEKIIQTIVSLLRQSGDQLEEKIKKDKVFYQHFKDMLSYPFFKRITDLFLEGVSADSTSEPGGQVQCTKVAFTMEAATRLTAVDNHPMNLVLGFGLKYLREHFKPWIQDQGGWEKALTSLDQEEVE
ncbi:PREDICTED: apoptosis facilitator Bcl-2-like protein 14 [Fulmarus glacialis]|uniref:apoptosis facilitator Bcl-2-like protein 14 n=1 Tax=Fulmarus glacialis TaxID=30455 RepID=UPI00051B1664|nr:PREDICTED: apoptosis facilitator Bcl-2-like protein 14 [Fulmarus glacialis]